MPASIESHVPAAANQPLTPKDVQALAARTPLPKTPTPSVITKTGTQKERNFEGQSAYFSARQTTANRGRDADALSLSSAHSSVGTLAAEPPTWKPAKPVTAMTAAHFGEQVAKLAQQTKVARNVMPMIVRGGIIASLGVFLFGHLAPLAVMGIMMGAIVGGYAIAKYMQLQKAKQFKAMGENNPLMLLQKNMPEDASAQDKAKLQSIVDFVEKGDVFGNGMLKTFKEPYQAITRKLNAAKEAQAVPQAPKSSQDAASITSRLSDAQQEKQDYLSGLKK